MVQKIAVAGKGGTGKSTLASMLVLGLVEAGKGPVLAVDADPDSNLSTLLGMGTETTIADLREDVRAEMKNFPAGMSKAHYVEAGLHQLIEEGTGFDLVTMGRGEGSGCYCYLNSLIKKFSDDVVGSYQWVVMDNEAGLEHLSRRTSADVDAFLVVVTDNPLSFSCAEKVLQITSEIENRIFKTYIVSNLVKDSHKDKIRERIEKFDAEYLCDIPYDPDLDETIFQGIPLGEMKKSLIHDSIQQIIDKIGG